MMLLVQFNQIYQRIKWSTGIYHICFIHVITLVCEVFVVRLIRDKSIVTLKDGMVNYFGINVLFPVKDEAHALIQWDLFKKTFLGWNT